jgi:sugar/nucleoside kinase (ribokinase family)
VLVDAQPPARITSARVTSTSPDPPPPGAPTLCLGEAVVDLVCERPLADVSAADAFVPHFGGFVASVAVASARNGAHVVLAGAAGEDPWGRWLRARLGREGVGTALFALVPGSQTPLQIVSVARGGEPTCHVYGENAATVANVFGDRALENAVRGSAAVFISSDTLPGAEESEVTMRARELALSLGRPVVFDPHLRLDRWRSRAEATAAANACVPDALLVSATARDAALMTGEDDPERAALAILKAGARMVVLTLGSEGAMLRGELRLDVDDVPATVLSTIGAGAVLTGVLLARLATSAFYPSVVAASLPEAVAQAAQACERWGALE